MIQQKERKDPLNPPKGEELTVSGERVGTLRAASEKQG